MIRLLKTSTLLMSLAASMAVLAAQPSISDPRPVVKTTEGQLQGHVSKGIYEFLGIHYGAPTGGNARFLPPGKPASWQGVKKADAKGDRCPQPPVNMPGEMATVLSFSDLPISEDCLVLDLWTPRVNDSGKRPVMVWLHGGGFFVGSGGDQYYHGSNLARGNDVVVVSLNHRLNTFGFFPLGPEAGAEYRASGNVGMMDIVRALEWVHDNIGAFGGDPGNVTIFGQSGGAGKVSALLAMPSAKGLFHKAIMQSGGGVALRTAEDALAVGQGIYQQLDVEPGDIEALQQLPMDTLVKAGAKMGLLPFGPHVDGDVVAYHPFDPEASPIQKDIPILVGYTKDEATNVFLTDPTWQTMTDEDLNKRVSGIVPADKVDATIALYRGKAPSDEPMHLWTSIVTDQMFGSSSILLAERKMAQRGAPVYMYKVNWESPVLGGKLRSPHAVEIPFVFDTVYTAEGLVGNGYEQEFMAKAMSQSFAAFARNGNPNTLGLPEWPPYSQEQRATLIFDNELEVIADPASDIRLFWEQIRESKTPGGSAIKDAFDAKKFE
ncbi:MAG: carboxylesterase/lipase family protein [Porticoccaceae bacterium]